MKTPDSQPAIDVRIRELTEKAEQEVRGTCQHFCEYARESPAKAMMAAAAAGYCLHWLPVRALVMMKLRIAAKLLPPLLFVYGAAKACEIARSCRNGSGNEPHKRPHPQETPGRFGSPEDFDRRPG